MSRKNKGKDKSSNRNVSKPITSEYDLQDSLSAIRRGAGRNKEQVEGTRTDVRVGSVNINVFSNPETNSETQSHLTADYVTEQYVQSLVNYLKADQTNSSTRLTDSFNLKLGVVQNDIDAVKEKSLSKSGFWVGVGIVIAVVGIVVTVLLFDLQSHKDTIKNTSETVTEIKNNVVELEKQVGAIEDSVQLIQKDIRNIQKHQNKKK